MVSISSSSVIFIMYGGVDKDGGAIVGDDRVGGHAEGVDIFQVAETAAAEEVLVCKVNSTKFDHHNAHTEITFG